MKYLRCLLVVACSLAAGAAFAETGALSLRKPQPNVSTRVAQYACLEGEHKCCCDRAGPLCCEGYTCVVTGSVGYCRPKDDDDE